MLQLFRVKLTHRPHYGGFFACTFHARQYRDQGAEICEVAAETVPPLPAHAVAVGYTHCHTCNREKGISLSSAPAVSVG